MHILLILLKIIGILLLFFVCLAGLVLLAAVRYSFSLRAEEGSAPACQIRVNWLLFVFSLHVSYIDNLFDYRLKLLGHQVMGNQKEFQKKKEEKQKRKEEKQEKKEEKRRQKEKKQEEIQEENVEAQEIQEENLEAQEIQEEPQEGKEKVQEGKEEPQGVKEEPQEGKEETQKECLPPSSVKEKSEKKKEKKAEKAETISSKLSGIGTLWERWKEINQNYPIQELIAFGKDCIFRIGKHILPRKLKGFVRFGFDNPATTGIVTGGIALFYPRYQKSLAVSPDFTAACFEGNLCGRGRIRPGYFLYMIFHILGNSEVRKLLKKMWKSR